MEPRRQQERRLRQLHDVSGQRPEDGQVLMWDASTGKWIPGDVSSDIDPDDFAPALHASQHFTGGDDEITPADIGAATSDHNHSGVYSEVGHDHDGVYSPIDHNHDATYRQLSVDIDTDDIEDEAITEDKLSTDVQNKLNAGGDPTAYTQTTISGGPLSGSNTQLVTQSVPAGTYIVFGGYTASHSTGFVQTVLALRLGTTETGHTPLLSSSVTANGINMTHFWSWRITLGTTTNVNIAGRVQSGSSSWSGAHMQIIKVG